MAARKLTETEREILTVCRDLMAVIAAIEDSPNWSEWELADVQELRSCGPAYLPSRWFGSGKPIPEKHRQRYRRAIDLLMREELLDVYTSDRGRLANLRVTDAGLKLIGKAKR